MRWHPIKINRHERFALEWVSERHAPAFSIPVANPMVEYSEYYRLSASELSQFLADEAAARVFAQRCGQREMDDRLIIPPGSQRG